MDSTNLPENLSFQQLSSSVAAAFDTFSGPDSLNPFASILGSREGSGLGLPTINRGFETIIDVFNTRQAGILSNPSIVTKTITNSRLSNPSHVSDLIDELIGINLENYGVGTQAAGAGASLTPLATDTLLDQSIALAKDYLLDFKDNSDYVNQLQLAFGSTVSAEEAADALDSLISGEAGLNLEVTEFEAIDAGAAFAEELNTVYFSETFLTQNVVVLFRKG